MLIKMQATVWLHRTNSFKIFVKDRTVPIQPMQGTLIDAILVDHLSVSPTNEITCHMVSFDSFGNEENFEFICGKFIEHGWRRR